MTMPFNILLFIGALALCIWCALIFVSTVTALAYKLHFSKSFISLTVFAFASSVPEMAVNVMASIDNRPEIVYGNIIGSNIFNLFGILGILALYKPLQMNHSALRRQIVFSILSIICLIVLVNDRFFFNRTCNVLSTFDGGILLLGGFQVFMFYVVYSLFSSDAQSSTSYTLQMSDIFWKNRGSSDTHAAIESAQIKETFPSLLFLKMFGSLIGCCIGGWFVVDTSTAVSKILHISEHALAVSIIAIATSLPEFLVSYREIFNKKPDIAIANVLGSNIFNILFILGISAIIRPVLYNPLYTLDIVFLGGGSLILIFFLYTSGQIQKKEGILFTGLYACYLVWAFIR